MNKLEIIKGDNLTALDLYDKEFLRAYVTDTRLMGVCGFCIEYMLTKPENSKFVGEDSYRYKALFYYDYEGDALDCMNDSLLIGNEEIDKLEHQLFSGLGGRQMELDEATALGAIKECIEKSLDAGIRTYIPSFNYYLKADTSSYSKAKLNSLSCVEIEDSTTLQNYFLMRLFGNDLEGMELLADTSSLNCEEALKSIFHEKANSHSSKFLHLGGTLYKNLINDQGYSESIFQKDGIYYFYLTKLAVENGKVKSFAICDSKELAFEEYSALLNKPEFITLYEYQGDDLIGDFEKANLRNSYSIEKNNGRNYLVFHENNSHVSQNPYFLSEDFDGSYFLSKANQILVVSQKLSYQLKMEYSISTSPLYKKLKLIDKYQFSEPILQHFEDSQINNFLDFIDFIM
ncbi:MAG: hypothetical protein MJ145_01365 [Clostridia bacterium]|nr:hypothetical protein [Clostridia bacterium]